MADTNAELGTSGWNITKMSGTPRTCENYNEMTLDGANNNQNFSVACPRPALLPCVRSLS